MNRDCAIRSKLLQALDPTLSFQNQILTIKHNTQPLANCIQHSSSRNSLNRQSYIDMLQDFSQETTLNETDHRNGQNIHQILDNQVRRSSDKKKKRYLNIVSNSHNRNLSCASTKSLQAGPHRNRRSIFGTLQKKSSKTQLKRSTSIEIRVNNYQPQSHNLRSNMKQSIVRQIFPMNQILQLKNHVANNPNVIYPNPIIQNKPNGNILHMPIKRKIQIIKNIEEPQKIVNRQRYSHLRSETRIDARQINYNHCNTPPIRSIPINVNNKENAILIPASISNFNNPERQIKIYPSRPHQFVRYITKPQYNQKPVFRTITKRQIIINQQNSILKNQLSTCQQNKEPNMVILNMLQNIIEIQNNHSKLQNKQYNNLSPPQSNNITIGKPVDNAISEMTSQQIKSNEQFLKPDSELQVNQILTNRQFQPIQNNMNIPIKIHLR